MKRVVFAAAVLAGACIWAVPACTSGVSVDLSGVNLPDAGLLDGAVTDDSGAMLGGVGAACSDAAPCRTGLACTNGTCAPGHSVATGGACEISAECSTGDYCAAQKCAPSGTGDTNGVCASDADCKSGLRCDVVNLSTVCQPEGTKDIGGDCTTSADCYGGLSCAQSKCIVTPPGTPIGGLPWQGVDCPTETGDTAAYFEVPKGGQQLEDFFRLPYPNDIRKKGANLDLTGFPTPGSGTLGFDLVDRWARYLEKTGTGYSVYPTVTFRFSGAWDSNTLNTANTIVWTDLTTGNNLGLLWNTSTGRSAYVCPNWLAVRPPVGQPLVAGHSYAVYFTNNAKTADGKAIVVSDDFKKVVGATDPGGDLSAAWTAYKPFRDWATTKSFDLTTVVNAAVFTVGTTDAIGKSMPQLVANATAPTATTWVNCANAPSPCPQADGDRACPATPNPDFDELHALIHIPNFQKGNIPYLTPADDGTFTSGAPQNYLDVCAAITVPKGATGAIPALVYAHGTGGSFRSHAEDGSGDRMAKQGIAVLGIDQVGHGTRRGTSTASPDDIFFNFTNPPAAEGNVLQGAADQLSLVRFLKAGVTVDNVTLGGAIAYWGHSQGATEGAISVPYSPDVKGMLFSGEGGSLIDSLLTKTSPVNLAGLAPVLLSEAPSNIVNTHPVFSMFQNAIDPADPLDHARNTTDSTLAEKHIFVPYGQQDTYATPITQLTYITAAGLWVAPTPASVTTPDKLNRTPETSPVTANINGFTAVTRQYPKPASSDGHFVVYDDPDAKKDADAFLKNALAGINPTVPAP